MASMPVPVDVTVVGCGVIGASAAWRLSQLGLTVSCFDPAPGEGATYAAAGMLAPVNEAEFGERQLTLMNLESARAWPAFAAEVEAETGLPAGLRRNGSLAVAFDAGDRQQLRRLLELRRQWDLDVEEISADDARVLEPLLGPRISAALWAPSDVLANPRQLMAALLAALDARGVTVVRRRVAGVRQSARTADVDGVIDERGEFHPAGTVVVAAGWRSREVLRDVRGIDVPTRPVKGQIVRLDARSHPELAATRVIRGLVQARPVYLAPRADGEVVVGATSEEQPDDGLVTAGAMFGLLRDIRALVPAVDELPVMEATARARPGTPDNLPLIGASAAPGLVLATGHYRNGVLLAPLTASAVAAQVAGKQVSEALAAADPRRFSVAADPM